jgi:hypothetical protein
VAHRDITRLLEQGGFEIQSDKNKEVPKLMNQVVCTHAVCLLILRPLFLSCRTLACALTSRPMGNGSPPAHPIKIFVFLTLRAWNGSARCGGMERKSCRLISAQRVGVWHQEVRTDSLHFGDTLQPSGMHGQGTGVQGINSLTIHRFGLARSTFNSP